MAPIKLAVGVIALLGCADLAFRAEVKDTAGFRAQSDDTATATKNLTSAAFDVRKNGSNGSETGVAAGTQEEQVANETFETDEPSDVKHEDDTPVKENGQSKPRKFGGRGKNIQSKLTRRLTGKPDALDQMAEFWQVPSESYIKNGVLDQVALIDAIVDKQLGIMPMDMAISTAEEEHPDETVDGRGKDIQSTWTSWLKEKWYDLQAMAELWLVPVQDYIKNGVLDRVALLNAIIDAQLNIMPMETKAEEKHKDETPVKQNGQSEPRKFKTRRGQIAQSKLTKKLAKYDKDTRVLAALRAEAENCRLVAKDYTNKGVLNRVALIDAIVVQQLLKQC